MRKVITYETSRNARVNICPECEKKLQRDGNWPRDAAGEEHCKVFRGLHFGTCDECESGRLRELREVPVWLLFKVRPDEYGDRKPVILDAPGVREGDLIGWIENENIEDFEIEELEAVHVNEDLHYRPREYDFKYDCYRFQGGSLSKKQKQVYNEFVEALEKQTAETGGADPETINAFREAVLGTLGGVHIKVFYFRIEDRAGETEPPVLEPSG